MSEQVGISLKHGVAFAAATLLLVPAVVLAAPGGKTRPPSISLSLDKVAAFTPADADPRLAAALKSSGASLGDFKFTPAAARGRPSQVRVAVRARSAAPQTNAIAAAAAIPATPLNPTSYNLGVAVGWKRFAVAGDVAKAKDSNPAFGERDSAVVGVSYSLKKFTGRVAVGAERNANGVAAVTRPDNVSLDLGGAYNISRRVAVTGGVRYRVDQDRVAALADQRRDSQAVYVGTAFKF